MATPTNAEQESHSGLTALTEDELNQVCGGRGAEFLQLDRFNPNPQPEQIITPSGLFIARGLGPFNPIIPE